MKLLVSQVIMFLIGHHGGCVSRSRRGFHGSGEE